VKRKRRLVVPVVLAITTAAVTTVTMAAGCIGDDRRPPLDAGISDAQPDTPII
jgi:hypothetical protein